MEGGRGYQLFQFLITPKKRWKSFTQKSLQNCSIKVLDMKMSELVSRFFHPRTNVLVKFQSLPTKRIPHQQRVFTVSFGNLGAIFVFRSTR